MSIETSREWSDIVRAGIMPDEKVLTGTFSPEDTETPDTTRLVCISSSP